jgi:predicted Zn finger-like uncharacterized protein
MIGAAFTAADSPSGVQRSVFTQCSKCETVFRLSAEALRAAGGQVRCGRCGEVFNALARLAEDSRGFTKGESSLDLETRADEILESVLDELEQLEETQPADAVDEVDLPPGVEGVQLHFVEPIDEHLLAENSLEFTLPAGDLDRIFIETRPTPLRHLVDQHSEAGADRLLLPTPRPPTATAPAAESAAAPEPTPLPNLPSVPATHFPPLRAVPSPDPNAPLTRIPGLEVAQDVRDEVLPIFVPDDLPLINPPRRTLPPAAWVTAAVVLAILLIIQIVRGNHEWLATHAPRLLTGYATAPSASLSSYQLRQWGVSGDPAAKGTLRVRASIMNTAAQLQRYPLLRVSLVNRFGSRVGAREFEPVEYLGKEPGRMLAPGERADATLDIVDPGKDAEGFEIDVCIRRIDKTIACASDVAPQPK